MQTSFSKAFKLPTLMLPSRVNRRATGLEKERNLASDTPKIELHYCP